MQDLHMPHSKESLSLFSVPVRRDPRNFTKTYQLVLNCQTTKYKNKNVPAHLKYFLLLIYFVPATFYVNACTTLLNDKVSMLCCFNVRTHIFLCNMTRLPINKLELIPQITFTFYSVKSRLYNNFKQTILKYSLLDYVWLQNS